MVRYSFEVREFVSIGGDPYIRIVRSILYYICTVCTPVLFNIDCLWTKAESPKILNIM